MLNSAETPPCTESPKRHKTRKTPAKQALLGQLSLRTNGFPRAISASMLTFFATSRALQCSNSRGKSGYLEGPPRRRLSSPKENSCVTGKVSRVCSSLYLFFY